MTRTGVRVTHGRHCPCSACERQDWTLPHLAPCGMHGPECPAVYAPYDHDALLERIGVEGNKVWRIIFCHGIGAPDHDTAYKMIEAVVKQGLGGDTKYAARVWERIGFMFDVEELPK